MTGPNFKSIVAFHNWCVSKDQKELVVDRIVVPSRTCLQPSPWYLWLCCPVYKTDIAGTTNDLERGGLFGVVQGGPASSRGLFERGLERTEIEQGQHQKPLYCLSENTEGGPLSQIKQSSLKLKGRWSRPASPPCPVEEALPCEPLKFRASDLQNRKSAVGAV